MSSSALPSDDLFSYSYRADGVLQTQVVRYNSTTTLSFAHSNAGRLQSRTDTATGLNATTTDGYDPYGQLWKMQYPGGTYANIEHDAGGRVLGSSAYQITYTARGEVAMEGGIPSESFYANGVAVTAQAPNPVVPNRRPQWSGIRRWGSRSILQQTTARHRA